jgi:hypothetical protein
MNTLVDERRVDDFLSGRSARFARKLTRHTALELRQLVDECRDGTEEYDYHRDDDVGGTTTSAGGVTNDDPRVENDGVVSSPPPTTPTPRQCDSLIIASKYDPTATLFRLLPYLAPSCPFVVYHEFLEPLLHTFHALQNYHVPASSGGEGGDDADIIVRENGEKNGDADVDDGDVDESSDEVADAASVVASRKEKAKSTTTPMMLRHNIAINLRLTDAWFREYQVLEGRTHPNMSMSQNGGYLLTGTKLCPRTGTNELDEAELREMRAKLGGRRKQLTRLQRKNKAGGGGGGGGGKRKADANDEKMGDEVKKKR